MDGADLLDSAATSQLPAVTASTLRPRSTRKIVRRKLAADSTEEVQVEDILLEAYAEDPPPPMSRRERLPSVPASASIAAAIAVAALAKVGGSLAGNILSIGETADSPAVLGRFISAERRRQTGRPSLANLILIGLLMSLTVVASANPNLGRQFTVLVDITVVLSLLAYLRPAWRCCDSAARRRAGLSWRPGWRPSRGRSFASGPSPSRRPAC